VTSRRMRILRTILVAVIVALPCLSAWSEVFLRWSDSDLPAQALGFSTLVISLDGSASPLLQAARKQGYRIYVEASVQAAPAAAEIAAKNGWAGIVLNIPQSEREKLQDALPRLRSAYPKVKFLVLSPDGKQPEMRGGLVIKRDSVLQVSSPTAQPWIDSNLALINVERRAHPGQVPLYTFSWNKPSGPEVKKLTASDYLLAIAEAGAFHGDLVLPVDEQLQRALSANDTAAWKLWNQVRAFAKFYAPSNSSAAQAQANVAVVVDEIDTNDEVMNLLARHNVPFKVFLTTDLKMADLTDFQVLAIFSKPDQQSSERLSDLAAHGKTVVLIDAHGSYPWQKTQAVQTNEQTVSYTVGTGRVLETSTPVSDPETFAQDIRRLLGKGPLLSVWNGLTTIAVPYGQHDETVSVVELVNYADEPLQVQVRVKGSFGSVRYESPEHPCCESLKPTQRDGFTEFVVPDLGIAGRVHLEATPSAAPKTTR
jgi:hypothetical protein